MSDPAGSGSSGAGTAWARIARLARGAGDDRLGVLVVARLVDQGSLGLGSLVLAVVLGPEAFAPVAMLFVVNSLVIQVSDLGVGFAVLRSGADRPVARSSLWRVRRTGLAVACLGVVGGGVCAALDQSEIGVVVGTSAVLWALAAESRVRKSSALTLGAVRQAARADITGALVFGVAVAAIAATDAGLAFVAAAFVVKIVSELAVVRTWSERFADDGEPARSGNEWLGQVMTYVVANADYAVMVVLLGPADLSRYAIAFRMASAIPTLVGNPITETAFLDLAGTEPSGRQPIHDSIRRRVFLLGAVGAAAVLVAAPILPRVLGGEWDEVGPLMAVLALAVPFRLLLGMTKALAITVGAARAVVGWELARLVVIVSATAAGAAVGGVVWATVGVAVGTATSIAVAYVRSARISQVVPARAAIPGALAATGLAIGAGLLFG